MPKLAIERVAPSSIREVAAFTRAQHAFEEWQTRHPKAYDELVALRATYNATLEAADAAVRGRRVACGPFDLYKLQPKYNADALYEAVGRQRFASSGGKLEPVEEKTVEAIRFEALVADGRVSGEIVAKVVTYTPYFHAPPAIAIP